MRRAPDHLRLVRVGAELPEPEPQIEQAGGVAVDDVERHRSAERGGALLQVLDQPAADPASPIARDEMELAKVDPADELGHLDPADDLPFYADDPRLMLSVSLPKLGADPPGIPPADLGQMSMRAVEIKSSCKVEIARFRRSEAEILRQPAAFGHSVPQRPILLHFNRSRNCPPSGGGAQLAQQRPQQFAAPAKSSVAPLRK